MSEQRFRAKPVRRGKGAVIALPFSPDAVWGAKERHHVTGTVDGCAFRGPVVEGKLSLGPAWVRDHPLPDGEVEVTLRPEGPQMETLAPDIASALASDGDAKAFFDGLATFYRKGFIRWIEDAKRPETRANRIAEMMTLLKQRRRER